MGGATVVDSRVMFTVKTGRNIGLGFVFSLTAPAIGRSFQVGDSEWSKPFSMETVGVNQVCMWDAAPESVLVTIHAVNAHVTGLVQQRTGSPIGISGPSNTKKRYTHPVLLRVWNSPSDV